MSPTPRPADAYRPLLVIAACLAATALPSARGDGGPEDRRPKGYVAPKAAAAVVVDGKLDDAAWKDAPWTDDFVDIEGEVRPRPRFRTRAKMAWDDRYFYVAAELQEPRVWAALTDHDAVIFQDNDFEVFIDPDGDNHEYYEFEINALNTGWDLFLKKPYRDGGPALNEWAVPGLLTAVHINGTLNDAADVDASWTVEIAFPWKVLAEYAHRPAPPKAGDQWRVNFSRVEWLTTEDGKASKKVPGRPEDNWVWSPQGAVDMHRPERWGYVQFADGERGRTFLPDPAWPVRDRLVEIYQAQREYFAAHKAWSGSAEALALSKRASLPGEGPPVIRLRKDEGYEASIALDGGPSSPARTWTIQSDSRITSSAAAR